MIESGTRESAQPIQSVYACNDQPTIGTVEHGDLRVGIGPWHIPRRMKAQPSGHPLPTAGWQRACVRWVRDSLLSGRVEGGGRRKKGMGRSRMVAVAAAPFMYDPMTRRRDCITSVIPDRKCNLMIRHLETETKACDLPPAGKECVIHCIISYG